MDFKKIKDSRMRNLESTMKIISIYMVFSGALSFYMWSQSASDAVRFLSISSIVGSWVVFLYCIFFQKHDLSDVGISEIQLVGAKLSAEWRDKVWNKGKITHCQWALARNQAGLLNNLKLLKIWAGFCALSLCITSGLWLSVLPGFLRSFIRFFSEIFNHFAAI